MRKRQERGRRKITVQELINITFTVSSGSQDCNLSVSGAEPEF